MKQIILFFTFLLLSYPLYSQNKEEVAIMNSVINFIKPSNCVSNTLFIQNQNFKTYFSVEEFIEKTKVGDNLPEKILFEFQEFKSPNILFDKDIIENMSFEYNIKLCDRKSDNLEGVILSFSNPIFDKRRQYCIITATESLTKDTFISNDYFLIKIYNKWLVFETFNYIIS